MPVFHEDRPANCCPAEGVSQGQASKLLPSSYGDGNTPGNLIRAFTYDDVPPWPTDPDGNGPSMVLQSPWNLPDHQIGANWRASHVTGGQPGAIDSWTFHAWLGFHGIPSALASDDPDLDGLANLVEYFLGTDPLHASPDQAPAAAIDPLDPGSGEADYFTLTFQHSLNADDLTFTVQESGDLVLWNSSGTPVEVGATPLGPALEILRYRSSQPTTSHPDRRLFMRLGVTEAP